MNNTTAVFAPNCSLLLTKSALVAARADYSLNSRQLFYFLIHVSEHYLALPVARDFVSHALTISKNSKPLLKQNSVDCLHVKIDWKIYLSPTLIDKSARTLLVQLSPIMLTTPSWLQNIAQAATNDHPIAVDLFAVYLNLMQQLPEHSYQTLLFTYGLNLPRVSTWDFSQQPIIADAMFDLGTLQLALGQLPRIYFPEILGFSLAYCQTIATANTFSHKQLQNTHPAIDNFVVTQQTLASTQILPLKQIIRHYLREFMLQKQELWGRIQNGHQLYQHYFEQSLQQLQARLQRAASPEQALLELLQKIIPKAIGHHGKIELGGKNLDAWFRQKPFAAKQFFYALRNSSYVNQQNLKQSPLLQLFAFKGPMFGVLNNAEKKIIVDWLFSPTSDNVSNEPSKVTAKIKPSCNYLSANAEAINFAKLPNQYLYYYLLNADLYPEVYATARAKAQNILTKTSCLACLPFKRYQHAHLEEYIQMRYQKEMAAYRPLQKPRFTRETYIWGIEQLAPTVLTDGCWLQSVGQLQFYSMRNIGTHLFSIYSDEIGGGKDKQNHPFIYRQLLKSLNIALPPTHSLAFIEHPKFIAGVFDLPVYLLAIGKFPSQFLPEILGVNLAIELSGLGQTYMNLIEELDYWGIDSTIVKIHLSIDNMATGHTALALQAIKFYLDDMLAIQGDKIMNKHWRRIYTGYCSLRLAGVRFACVLAIKYQQKKLSQSILGRNF